jgi:hypothetical protein
MRISPQKIVLSFESKWQKLLAGTHRGSYFKYPQYHNSVMFCLLLFYDSLEDDCVYSTKYGTRLNTQYDVHIFIATGWQICQ